MTRRPRTSSPRYDSRPYPVESPDQRDDRQESVIDHFLEEVADLERQGDISTERAARMRARTGRVGPVRPTRYIDFDGVERDASDPADHATLESIR